MSIKDQDYSRLELIISVDGGTPDLDWESQVVQKVGVKNIKILYHNGNPGIFSNINHALKYVSGDFVQLFSQDDRMYPGFLDKQSEVLMHNPKVAMVFSAFDVIDERGEIVNESIQFTFKPDHDCLIKSAESIDLFIEHGCLPGNISPVMLRRNLFTSIGLFDESLPYAGDFDYWVRVSKNWDLYYLCNPGLQVRRHDKQASMTMSNRQLYLDLVHIYRTLLKSVPKEGLKSKLHHLNRKVGAAFIHHSWISLLRGKSHIRTFGQRWKDMQQYPFNAFWASTYYGISIPSRIIRRITK